MELQKRYSRYTEKVALSSILRTEGQLPGEGGIFQKYPLKSRDKEKESWQEDVLFRIWGLGKVKGLEKTFLSSFSLLQVGAKALVKLIFHQAEVAI